MHALIFTILLLGQCENGQCPNPNPIFNQNRFQNPFQENENVASPTTPEERIERRKQVEKQRTELAKIYRQEAFARMRERARQPKYYQPTFIDYAQAYAIQQGYRMMFPQGYGYNSGYSGYNSGYSGYNSGYSYGNYGGGG
jgi:hypothetical protein